MIICTGRSRKETHWTPKDVTWEWLKKKFSEPVRTQETVDQYQHMTKDQKGNAKDVGGIVGGEIYGEERKKSNIKNRCILALDIDYGTADTWDDVCMLLDYTCLMHTTHSHTPEAPRYRLYFPLAHTIAPDQYEPVARRIASYIGIELFDDTTYDFARLMYWPSCPKDGVFDVWTQDGELLDPDRILATYDNWHDQREWPASSRQANSIRKEYEAKARQENPLHKGGVVGAFCRVYTVPEAIKKYLPETYVPVEGDENRWTYTQGHTTGGMVVYDDGLFCFSHHDTDPAGGRLCNAYDLVRIHLYGETEGSGDRMRELCQDDTEIRHELEKISLESASRELGLDDSDSPVFKHDFTEQGNARLLANRVRNILRWQGAMGWMFWNGQIWVQDAETEAIGMVMNLNDKLMADAEVALQLAAPKTHEAEIAKQMYGWAKKSRKYTTTSGVLHYARKPLGLRADEEFDGDPWVINTPDAIFDLRDGRRMPHDSAYMCTKMTTVTPDWQKARPKWEQFLQRITGGDHEFEHYLQVLAGMACVGKVYEEGVVIAYGPGGNGKSTLFNVWQMVLGTYAGTIRNEIIMGNKNGSEVAGQTALRGLRLAITGELEENAPLQIGLLKKLTSRDAISARALYHEPMTFIPSHTLILHTNYLPTLRSLDAGTRRRIAVAPFTASIPSDQVVMDFAGELLREEGPQILAWMIDGAGEFFRSNMKLVKPAAVVKATEAYIAGEDKFGTFLTECCVLGDTAGATGATGAAALYNAYRTWCAENGIKYVESMRNFAKQLQSRKVEMQHTRAGNVYVGVELKDEYAL